MRLFSLCVSTESQILLKNLGLFSDNTKKLGLFITYMYDVLHVCVSSCCMARKLWAHYQVLPSNPITLMAKSNGITYCRIPKNVGGWRLMIFSEIIFNCCWMGHYHVHVILINSCSKHVLKCTTEYTCSKQQSIDSLNVSVLLFWGFHQGFIDSMNCF